MNHDILHKEEKLKSFTIHGVDEQLAARLKQTAERWGTSMNRTIKRLLAEAVGMKPKPPGHNREQFEDFCGVWSEQELAAFHRATADLEHVHDGDWQ
jgi:hypothetical protein